jgi:hypothetical protein
LPNFLFGVIQLVGVQPTVEEVKYADAHPGFFNYIKMAGRAVTGSKFTLDATPANDPREFDVVLFGGPIWGWKSAPPLLVCEHIDL